MGRKPWSPTADQRLAVRRWAIAGFSEDQIAARLNVDPKTLRRACRAELDDAFMDVLANTGLTVVQMANGRPAEYDKSNNLIRAELLPSLGACCFLLKTRGKKLGWSERLEVTGPDGKGLFDDLNFSALNNDEFGQLQKLLRKIGLPLPDRG